MQLSDLEGVKAALPFAPTYLDIAPNGRLIALETFERVVIIDAHSGAVVRRLGQGVMPIWAPNSVDLAFYSTRSGRLQLWNWQVGGLSPRQLTHFPVGIDPDMSTGFGGIWTNNVLRFSWSPDGSRIVFSSRVRYGRAPAPGTPLILDNSTPLTLTLEGVLAEPSELDGIAETPDGRTPGFRHVVPGENAVSQLFTINVRTGSLSQLTAGDRAYFHPQWSPDGASVVAAATELKGGRRYRTNGASRAVSEAARTGELVLIDVNRQRLKVLVSGKGIKYRPQWSPDGAELAYFWSATPLTNPTIGILMVDQSSNVRSVNMSGKIADFRWQGTRSLWVSRYAAGEFVLNRVSVESARVSPKGGWHTAAWSTTAGGVLAYVDERLQTSIWLLSTASARAKRLATIGSPHAGLNLGQVKSYSWRTRRGDEMTGELLVPPGYRPGSPYPAIVDVYPLWANGWMQPIDGNQAWASAGYVVFKPMPRAPLAWTYCSASPKFCGASKGSQAWNTTLDDVMSGVDSLIKRRIIDPTRMCVYGHSNGATTVDVLVTKTNRFKCAVAVAGALPDWVSAYFFEAPEWVRQLAGRDPWQSPKSYVNLSAVFHVGNVKTPMLLAVGDKDGGFLLGSIRMYNALRQAGKDVTLLRYPGQGHIFTGAAMRDFWTREMTFFCRYLKPQKERCAS